MNEQSAEFKIECPHCGQHLAFDSSMFNQVFQCPACGGDVKIPPMPDSEPTPVVINVVRRGDDEKSNRLLHTIGIASAVIVATILAVVRAISFLPVLIALLFGPDQEEMSEDSQPTTEQTAYSSDDDESITTQEYKTPAKNPQSYARNQKVLTDSEKLAMGRVFYVFAKKEILMSQFAEQGETEGEAAVFQFLAALGGGAILTQVSTDGCPEDFANAWKRFAASAALLQTAESGYSLMIEGLRYALQNGQYVDRESLQKIAELEEKLPEVRRMCKRNMEAFVSVCQNYGMENLLRWSLEAYQRYEGDPNAKLFDSDK